MTGDKATGGALFAFGAVYAVYAVIAVLLGNTPEGTPAEDDPETWQGRVWLVLSLAGVAAMAFAALRAKVLPRPESTIVFWAALTIGLVSLRASVYWWAARGAVESGALDSAVDGAVWYAVDTAVPVLALYVGARLWRMA